MGIIKRLLIKAAEADEKRKREEAIKQFDPEKVIKEINEKRLSDAIENGDEREVRYYRGQLDKAYQIASDDYWHHNILLEQMKVDKTISKEEFENACEQQMLRAYAFKESYDKYNIEPLYASVFKTYALFLEREGRFVDAATVCAKSLRWGFPNDRTQGGMAGRLVKLVKKAGGETNEEIEDALREYCQHL